MVTALVVLAGLFGLVTLLLAVPLVVVFRFEGLEALSGQVAVRWLFGLVRLRVRVPGSRQTRDPQSARDRGKTRQKPGKGGRRLNITGVLRQAAFRRRVYRLLKDFFGAVHLHRLRLHMRLGLGDPADTGRLWALVGPLNAAAQNLRGAEVWIEPEFTDPVLEYQTEGRLLLIPLQVLALAIGFALSPASIRAWRTLRASHA